MVIVQNADKALDTALEMLPDLILLDLHMPHIDGFEVLAQLSTKLPASPVVVVSGSIEPDDMQRAISMGAMGYIPKSASSEIMEKALMLVTSGGIYIPPEMLQTGSKDRGHGSQGMPGSTLTPRQIEVLQLLSEGKVNKEIARELDCAETTVKAHITAIFRELKARNRTEAVIQAQKMGYIGSKN